MSALTDFLTSLSNKIRSKLGTTRTYTPTQAVAAIDDVYTKGVTDTKKGNASDSDVKSGKTYTSTNGVNRTGTFAAQELEYTPSGDTRILTPDNGKYLSKVTVKAVTLSGSASTSDVYPGKTFYNTSLAKQTGTMKNLNTESRYQLSTDNATKVLLADSVYFSNVYDQVSRTTIGNRVSLRYSGSKDKSNNMMYGGYLPTNTLVSFPTQAKSYNPNRVSQRTVTADSGYILQSVTVGKIPDAYGRFTPSSSQYNTADADMGLTNNFRTVNTSVCYNAGYNQAKTDLSFKIGRLVINNYGGGWGLFPLPYTTSGIIIIKITYDVGNYVSGDFLNIRNSSLDASPNYGLNLFLSQNQVQMNNADYIFVELVPRSATQITIEYRV